MTLSKDITLNMPNMALEAMSENWLFKELGDTHWALICDGLQTKSFDLKNDTEDRLYATFVRIKISCDKTLKSFVENEKGNLEGKISRFGNSMYFSDISFSTGKSKVKAEMMTTFSIRNKNDNTKLAKSEPSGSINNVEVLTSFPKLGNEYRLLKKRILKKIDSTPYTFEVEPVETSIFDKIYQLNPFYDLNGVNLLYFAAYPIINDFCEAEYFNQQFPDQRWEQTYYTAHKDVFYYANCNINEQIIYRMHSCEKLENADYKISSSLIRKSDNTVIAKIFTVKSKNHS